MYWALPGRSLGGKALNRLAKKPLKGNSFKYCFALHCIAWKTFA